MKTAVEWLIGYINHLNENGYDFRPKYDENIVEQAKEMEKEQINNAHYEGSENYRRQYYNETFKSE
jgi:hypothetical protein